jgi:trans-aconitate 2-methyltransferase
VSVGWNPEHYLKFADHRLRPAIDLMERINIPDAKTIYDLGCGPGTVTRLLAERWPGGGVTGVDSSPQMLARAAREAPGIQWLESDIATWVPTAPVDLIFSNAALHWCDDHQSLFPGLMENLATGGVLAVQMPKNHEAPSHTLMAEVVRSGPWADLLTPLVRESPVASAETYYDLLAAQARSIDIWESQYVHILEGPDAVFEWVRGTALKPLLDALQDCEQGNWDKEFSDQYKEHLNRAYPQRSDGRTLFNFRRLFLIVVK